MSDDPQVGRACAWCGGVIKRFSRSDADTCSKRCRQARHRFRIALAPPSSGGARLRMALSDPPYVGLSARYYSNHPAFAGEVNHAELIAMMCDRYDAWALCCSSPSLQELLGLCPSDVRVGAWIKGSRSGVSNRARDAWEPVIFWRGRERRMEPTEALDNVLVWGGRQHSHPDALVGMKPAPFCEWVFRNLGAELGDTLDDLFPGSGAVGRAWLLHQGLEDADRAQQLGLFGTDPIVRTALPSRLEESASRTDRAIASSEVES